MWLLNNTVDRDHQLCGTSYIAVSTTIMCYFEFSINTIKGNIQRMSIANTNTCKIDCSSRRCVISSRCQFYIISIMLDDVIYTVRKTADCSSTTIIISYSLSCDKPVIIDSDRIYRDINNRCRRTIKR